MKRSVLYFAFCFLFLSPVSAFAVNNMAEISRERARQSGQAFEGPTYVAFTLGYASPEDSALESVAGFSFPGGDFSLDDGGAYLLSFGVNNAGYRLELEGGYRSFDIGSVAAVGWSADGDVEAFTLMGNVYMDFPLGNNWSWYVGGGVGAINVDGPIDVSNVTLGSARLSGDTWEFAYQGMTGLSWNFAQGATLTGGYRIFGFTDPQFGSFKYDAPVIHGLELGIRFSF